MKVLTTALMVFVLALGLTLIGTSIAQAQERGNGFTVRDFVDEDGDGFNDLAPDHDGDGIPNGQDPDYVRPEDGTGNQFGNSDTHDGDNMFQYILQHKYGYMYKWFYGAPDGDRGEGPGHGYGPGDGTGNDGEGPQDGTGFGPGGDGECDNDGPNGPGQP